MDSEQGLLKAELSAARQERLSLAAQDLASRRDLESIMAVVRRAARELVGSDGATFVLRDGDKCHYADEDAIAPLWKGQRFPMSVCISGWVMLHATPALIEDIYADARIPAEAYRPTFVKSLAMVPVGGPEPMAAIGNYWAGKHLCDQDELRLLTALANLASVAMENVRLYNELKNRAAELLAQKNLAEAATLAKNHFLANMSHELRTPLNAVLGFAQLLVKSPIDDQSRDYARIILDSGQGLLAIISDILDLSQIEAGQAELRPAPFTLRRALETALTPLRVTAEEKNMALSLEVDHDIPDRLNGDRGRLVQVLTNIADNAVKYTERGRVKVGVSLAEKSGDSALMRFTVTDTGIGIAPDRLQAIFEPFSQVGTSAHVKYGGTGLGLGIAKDLVQLMGGELGVRSTEGRGSSFFFTARFALDQTEARPEIPAPAKPSGRRLNILLAEDNPINRLMATEYLRSDLGHQVAEAENGQEALDMLKAQAFDLVLMDVRMPVMDGLEATRLIRAGQAGNPRVPIIAVTAQAFREEQELIRASGMDGYLCKPLDLDIMDRVIERILRQE